MISAQDRRGEAGPRRLATWGGVSRGCLRVREGTSLLLVISLGAVGGRPWAVAALGKRHGEREVSCAAGEEPVHVHACMCVCVCAHV